MSRIGFVRGVRALVVGSALFASGAMAATFTDMFSVDVSTAGKTESQVEAEVKQQLSDDGIRNANVNFQRTEDGHTMRIEGQMGNKRVFVWENSDENNEQVNMRVPALDLECASDLTNEEIVTQLQEQLKTLGIKGKAFTYQLKPGETAPPDSLFERITAEAEEE